MSFSHLLKNKEVVKAKKKTKKGTQEASIEWKNSGFYPQTKQLELPYTA